MADYGNLIIGNFTFPLLPKNSLNWKSDRDIAEQKAPGGVPIYQDLGFAGKTLDFEGSIVGDGAWSISEQIESLQWGGQEYDLIFGDIKKRVRIKTYLPKWVREDRVDYQINLVVCYPQDQIDALVNNVVATPASSGSASSSTSTNTTAGLLDSTYVVKQGDTLWNIATDIFGDGTLWPILAHGNGVTDERSLQIGFALKVPSTQNVGACRTAYQNDQNTTFGPTGQSELQTIAGGAAA